MSTSRYLTLPSPYHTFSVSLHRIAMNVQLSELCYHEYMSSSRPSCQNFLITMDRGMQDDSLSRARHGCTVISRRGAYTFAAEYLLVSVHAIERACVLYLSTYSLEPHLLPSSLSRYPSLPTTCTAKRPTVTPVFVDTFTQRFAVFRCDSITCKDASLARVTTLWHRCGARGGCMHDA